MYSETLSPSGNNVSRRSKYDLIMKLPVTAVMSADRSQSIDAHEHTYIAWSESKHLASRVIEVRNP